ncbi:unnamed protein product [Tilletia controversa]|nr:unnamed protein product [Tilletia controversa]
MVTRREEALGAVKLYPGEPYVGDASVAASPSLQWTGSDSEFVDSDLLVLFRNVASLVPVAGPILAPALAYVKDIVICVKTVKDNRRQAEALATDVLSHAQELLQTAKDADIRLLPGTPVANIVIRLEVRLKVILQNIRICQDPSANKFSKAFKQFVKRDDIAAILSDGREQLKLSMAAFSDEPLLPIAVASQSQSQLNASKHLPDFKQKAKEEAALPFRILEAELEHHGTVGAAHAPDPNTRDKVAADVAILHLLQQRARKLNPEMATSNHDDSVRTTALKLNRKVIESQQTGEDAQDRFESTKRLFALGTCLLQLAMYDQALPVWKLAAIDCRKLSAIPAELQLLLGLVLLALSQSYYMVSRLDEALDAAKECVDTLGKADVADEAVAASLDTARDFQTTLEQASNDGQSILSTSLFPSNDAAQGILVPPSALFSGRRMVAAVAEETQTREAEEAEEKGASKGHSDTQSNLKTKGALEKYKALSEHAVYLSKSGQPGDAARAVQIGESVAESYRKLCVEDTSRWRSNYAEALSDHAGYLLEWAERCDSATAAQVREKRVGVYERLHGLDASRWRPDYAKALSEHTEYLSKWGDSTTPAQIREMRVGVYERLHGLDAPRWLLNYVAELSDFAKYLSKSDQPGDYERAMQLHDKRVKLFKPLVALGKFRWNYVEALLDHVKYLVKLDRPGDSARAVQISEGAIELFSELYEENASRWRPYYAEALSNHAGYLSKWGDPGDSAHAVQISEKVIEMYKQLHTDDASKWQPDYAEVLSDHALYLSEWAKRGDSATAARACKERVGVYERLHGLDASRWRPDYVMALRDHAEYLSKSHQPGDSARAVLSSEKKVELYKGLYEEDASQWRSEYSKALSDYAGYLSKSDHPGGFARAVQASQRRAELFKEDVVQWKKPYEDAQESHASYLRIFEELKSPYPMVRYVLSPVSISVKHLVVALKKTNEQTRQLAEELEQIIRKVIVDLVASVKGTDNVLSVDSEFNIMTRRLDSDLVRVLKDISPGSQRWRFLAPWKRTENILAQAKKEFAVLYLNPCARPSVPGHVQPTLDLNRFSHYPDLGDLLEACNSSIPFVAATIRPVLISLDGILISVQDSENDDRWQAADLAIKILKRVTEFDDLFKGDDFMRSPDFAFVEAMRKLGDDLFELRSDMCTRQRASGHWWRIFIARKSVESLLVSGHKAFMANTKQAEMDVLYEREPDF